ncbi:substrate-binding periplasmic protein [Kiloniella sp. b19]|uniref:substrate-binding periplasmic protein n=1 Tax=Kiloniella sp. GXU_MW_B19 TaxID=3141326 RepID=UPI0031E3532B
MFQINVLHPKPAAEKPHARRAFLLTLLCAALSASLFSPGHARETSKPAEDANKLVILGLDNWPPFAGPDLPNQGFGIEVASTALKRAGYTVKKRVAPWGRLLSEAEKGVVHVLPNMWHSPKREAVFSMSSPYHFNKLVLVSRKDSGLVPRNLDSLVGLRVGTLKNSAYPALFMNDNRHHKQEVLEQSQNVKKLADNRVDAVIGDETVLKYLIKDQHLPLKDFCFQQKPLQITPMHIGVSRLHPDHAQLVRILDSEIAAMKSDGTFTEILQRHKLDEETP